MNCLPELRNTLAFIDPRVNLMEVPNEERCIFAGALLDVVHDHAKGISLTFEQSLFASGYALVRPLFEVFIRAAWVVHCATDSELSHFMSKDKICCGQLILDTLLKLNS